MFISSDVQDSPHYFEVELSPFNALYVSKIYNPFLNGEQEGSWLRGCA